MIDFNACFRPSRDRMTVAEAVSGFNEALDPIVGRERIKTRDALGRILSGDLIAPRDIPPHDNSAVDGYAVRFADLDPDRETRLPVSARIAAGHPHDRPIPLRSAAQIFTGAPLPDAAGGQALDTIFMNEDCRIEESVVMLPPGAARGANVRRAGEDVARGETVLHAGARLRPQDVGMAASLGFADIEVFKKLRVAIFSTGDEVREPGATLDPGSIFDINRYMLIGLLGRLGMEVSDLGIVADKADAVRAVLAHAAAGHDVLLTSGGVSHGGEDHVRAAVAAMGSVNFWNLAIKPGRAVALGYARAGGRDVPFIGLPGNPVAVMVAFLVVARPILFRLAGALARPPFVFRVRSGFDFVKKAGRREWLRARLVVSQDGWIAEKFSEDGSGILTSMVATDGLIELAETTTEVRRGDMVEFLSYAELMS